MKVEEIDKHVLTNIDKKKLLFLDIADNSAALRRAKKEAYFQVVIIDIFFNEFCACTEIS